ncbi:MAG: hypothetical protein P0Y66_16455 [Candidatus Kaistia colombiensis]|nr:MAG: hypothetical protein P0Y66_16455 [Kaistia sp.]
MSQVMSAAPITGGCLCGRIHYTIDRSPRIVCHCHCRMCQLAGGALFLTWATFDASRLPADGGQGRPSTNRRPPAAGISAPIAARR